MASPHDWIASFPPLARLELRALDLLRSGAVPVTVPAGTVLFRNGSACEHYLMCLAGSVRVQMTAETGREIVLYRVGRGETCVLTTSCLMTRADYRAEGIAETAVEAVTLSAARFRALVAESEVFREFVFSSFGTRLADLILLVEEVAFGRIDQRLAQVLLDRRPCGPGPALAVTHQEIAAELGTAREVVSRQLKEFERRGWVALARGRIALLRPEALRDLAGTGAV